MGPFGRRNQILPRLHQITKGTVANLASADAAAWILDETKLAARLPRAQLSRLRAVAATMLASRGADQRRDCRRDLVGQARVRC